MKKLHALLMASAAMAAPILGSCSKDDPSPEPLAEKTYTGFSELTMSYNGAPMAGKSVTVTPGADGKPASLACFSEFDLSQLGADFAGMKLPAPGVIPGSPSLILTPAISTSGSDYAFSGNGENDFVTYAYSGRVNPEKLSMDFTGVKLKDQSLAGSIWVPAPVKKDASGMGFSSFPIHFKWEMDLPLPIPGLEKEQENLVKMLFTLPIIPVYNGTAYMSIAQTLESGLKTLGFTDSGNLVVTYLKRAEGAAQFGQAPLCMLQYAPVAQNLIKLWVNPTDVLTVVLQNNTATSPDIPENPFGKNTRANTLQIPPLALKFIKAFLPKVAPLLASGIPVDYALNGETMELYLGNEFMLPLFQEIGQTILSDPEVQAVIKQAITDAVTADPSLAQYVPKIEQLLQELPKDIASTTSLEFGLSLVRYKS